MSTRTDHRTVTFTQPFHLDGIEGLQPPGAYLVDTDEETIDELSFVGVAPHGDHDPHPPQRDDAGLPHRPCRARRQSHARRRHDAGLDGPRLVERI